MLNFFLVILLLSTAPVLYRLLTGPTLADRVTAFDMLTCISIGFLTVFAIKTGNTFYIDLVMVMSFVVFLGAIAFSYYLGKRKDN